MNDSWLRDQEDYLFYGISSITIISVILGALMESVIPLLLPLGIMGVYFCIVDIKMVYFLLIGLLTLSTEIEITSGLSTDLPAEPIMWLISAIYIIFLFLYPEKARIPIKNPITILLMVHVLWIFVATFAAERVGVSIKFLLAKIWYVIPFYFVPFIYLNNKVDIKKSFYILFSLAFVAVSFVVIKHSTLGFSFDKIETAVQPIFRNHVNYACLLVILLPYLWISFFWEKTSSFAYWLIIIMNVLFPIAIYLSYTRAAIASVIIAAGAYFILRFKLTKIALILSALVAIVLLGKLIQDNKFMDYAPNFESTVSHRDFNNLIEATAKGEDISTMERVYRWIAGVRMVTNKPLTGYGPNNFYPTYKRYTISSFETYVSNNPKQSGIHNYYLMVAVEQGIPGIIIFLAFAFITLIYAEKNYHLINDRFYKGIIAGAYMSFIVILSILIVNDLLEADKVGPFFFLAAAFIGISKDWVKNQKTSSVS